LLVGAGLKTKKQTKIYFGSVSFAGLPLWDLEKIPLLASTVQAQIYYGLNLPHRTSLLLDQELIPLSSSHRLSTEILKTKKPLNSCI